jgi:hypothetical protein
VAIKFEPPMFDTLSASATLQTLLRDGNKFKCFAADDVPQGTKPPYVAWSIVGGSPENFLGASADMDGFDTQIDVYAKTQADCREIVAAIDAAIDGKAYITNWLGQGNDQENTKLDFRSFSISWLVPRQ